MDGTAASDVAERMRADLPAAMKARDAAAVLALRTGLAAIANAEAPPVASATGPGATPAEPVVGQLVEHDRLELSAAAVDAVLRHEIADRHDTIAAIERHGRDAEVADLLAEIAVLERYLS